jgi:hypothetical protein
MKKSSVLNGLTSSGKGREAVQNDPRNGHPRMQSTDKNVSRVRNSVKIDQRFGVSQLANDC